MRNNILLNPGPTNTLECVKEVQYNLSDVCHRTAEFFNLLTETKAKLLHRFSPKASSEEWNVSILGGSGTAAMESLISSLLSKSTIIIAGKYGERAAKIMSLHGIEMKEIRSNSKEELEYSDSDPNLYFVENETTTGEKFDLESISQLFPKSRLYIDATSAFGATDYTDFLKQIDAISFCSNKCLQSTPGLGIIIWRNNLKALERNYYLDLNKYSDNKISFTLPVQSIAALHKALTASIMSEEDFNKRRNLIIKDFEKIKIKCINKNPSNSIIGFRHPNKSHKELEEIMKDNNIIIYDGIPNMENSFRISTMSVEFDKEYNYIIEHFTKSCLD